MKLLLIFVATLAIIGWVQCQDPSTTPADTTTVGETTTAAQDSTTAGETTTAAQDTTTVGETTTAAQDTTTTASITTASSTTASTTARTRRTRPTRGLCRGRGAPCRRNRQCCSRWCRGPVAGNNGTCAYRT